MWNIQSLGNKFMDVANASIAHNLDILYFKHQIMAFIPLRCPRIQSSTARLLSLQSAGVCTGTPWTKWPYELVC